MTDCIGLSALTRCIEILGSQTAVGTVVHRSPQAVSEIVRRGRQVPAEWCRPLEAATAEKGERIPAAALRPDLFGEIAEPVSSSTEAAA